MEIEGAFVETLLSAVRSSWDDEDGGYMDTATGRGVDFAAYVQSRLVLADAPRHAETWRRSREGDQDAAFVVEIGAQYLLEAADLGKAEKAAAQKLLAFSAWARAFENGYIAGVQDTIMEEKDQNRRSP